MEIGNRVKELRKSLGLTQKELAEKCGYKSLTTINKIELGINNIPLNIVEKLADALEVSPSYLMGWNTNSGINNGIIGNNNSQCSVNNGSCGEIEKELLLICSKLSTLQKADLLTYASNLIKK